MIPAHREDDRNLLLLCQRKRYARREFSGLVPSVCLSDNYWLDPAASNKWCACSQATGSARAVYGRRFQCQPASYLLHH